ncbi:hypothetical protein [Chitinophaga rhizophila]|uniref:Uncharacterized protein n=1 Tax=Chitinophaga rhizophila TaxID=2866212 RepID=A0ABS7GHN1_9BACT|nr:hypothetical protein [Chitinophaga rhizophila]MBW8687199.1 hypothetical protein [Chitinophaga rhizophila]
MKHTTKIMLFTGMVAFFVIQVSHTIRNTNSWPFCSYNMFNRMMQPKIDEFMIWLYDSKGNKQLVLPGNAIPIEYYRTPVLMSDVFDGNNESSKVQLCRILLDHLNTAPWGKFDEILPSARPTPGSHFTGMEVFIYNYDLDLYRYGQKLEPVNRKLIYSYHQQS